MTVNVSAVRPVTVLATGGTILTSSRDGLVDTDVEDIPTFSGPDLEIHFEKLMAKPGRDLTLEDLVFVARRAEQLATSGNPVVVVHGTDTLEETAYLLALTIQPGVPVVVTGAMRRVDDPGPDGPANLAAAIAVAQSRITRHAGPVVVMNDEIHSSFWARKGHSTSPSTFTSAPAGPIGAIVEGRPELWMTPDHDPYLGPVVPMPHRVPVVHVSVGLTPDLLPDSNHIDGVVIAGTGGGHVPSTLVEWIDTLIEERKPVVIGTRVAEGRTLTATYGGPGSEQDLLHRGCVGTGYLSVVKARLRLLYCLACGKPSAEAFQRESS